MHKKQLLFTGYALDISFTKKGHKVNLDNILFAIELKKTGGNFLMICSKYTTMDVVSWMNNSQEIMQPLQ